MPRFTSSNAAAALLLGAALLACTPAFSAPPAPGGGEGKGPPAGAPSQPGPSQGQPQGQPQASESKGATIEANKEAIAPDDATASRNAARTRMRECGHQWSGLKKSGGANGMTWKDFSQGCLARK